MRIGILSKEEIEDINERGPARVFRPSQESLEHNTSAIDLPIGDEYWVMKGSCRAGKRLGVEDIKKHAENPKPERIEGPVVLHKHQVYLIRLDCELNLTDTEIEGKCTARSSIGRLDVLVRLLADQSEEFDCIPKGYRGSLYVEVAPIAFDVVVKPGTCLSQLRLFRAPDRMNTLTIEELWYENPYPVVDKNGKEIKQDRNPHEHGYPFCLDLSKDPYYKLSGFVAKRDVSQAIDPTLKGHYDPKEFWDPVEATDNWLQLETDRLYILRSEERLRLPAHLALECEAYTETLGEWRIEYAGFAHPFFGNSRPKGSPIMFEVRGHNIPTILTDGIPLGLVSFKRMSKQAVLPEEETTYEKQELALSSCFKPWPAD